MGNLNKECKMKDETKQELIEMAIGLIGGLAIGYGIIYSVINGLVR